MFQSLLTQTTGKTQKSTRFEDEEEKEEEQTPRHNLKQALKVKSLFSRDDNCLSSEFFVHQMLT